MVNTTIESSVTGIFNAIVQNNWKLVTDEQKEKFFFIFNRYMAKRYPVRSFKLNDKGTDKVMGMNIIAAFLTHKFKDDKEYPNYLWSKSTNNIEKKKEHKDDTLLKEKLDVTDDELNLLKQLYADEIKEELKYFKSLEKNKDK